MDAPCLDGGEEAAEPCFDVGILVWREAGQVALPVDEPSHQFQPAQVFQPGNHRVGHLLVQQPLFQAVVRVQFVEIARTALVRHRGTVQAVEVRPVRQAHLPAVQVVEEGGGVVAVQEAGLVVGVGQVDVAPHQVEAVDAAVQAEPGRLLSVEPCPVGTQRVGPFLSRFFVIDQPQQHGIDLVAFPRTGVGLFQCVRRQPVVAVDHGDEFARGMAQAGVPRFGLSAVGGLTQQQDAIVLLGILLCDGGRAVGRGIVDDDDLQLAQGLLPE